MNISRKVNMIEVQDWDDLVSKTYGRPYNFQQQNGCQGRGIVQITIPDAETYPCDEDMHDEIPEIVNGEIMGVKFKVWLDRNQNRNFPIK